MEERPSIHTPEAINNINNINHANKKSACNRIGGAFIDVIDLAIVDNGNPAAAGTILSVWFGNFDEANSQPLSRYLRWKLVIAGTASQQLFCSVRLFLKNKN